MDWVQCKWQPDVDRREACTLARMRWHLARTPGTKHGSKPGGACRMHTPASNRHVQNNT
jgi:hypothetical protein